MTDTEVTEEWMTLSPSIDERPAVRFLTYLGRIEPPHPHRPMGPNTLEEFLWPVTWYYNKTENISRVGYSYIGPPKAEMEQELKKDGVEV